MPDAIIREGLHSHPNSELTRTRANDHDIRAAQVPRLALLLLAREQPSRAPTDGVVAVSEPMSLILQVLDANRFLRLDSSLPESYPPQAESWNLH